ncbi:hypothetical protein Trco_004768 [Trichoderma cornu-damae]|uniref:Uncharacterized protein n=1 Tax=Trichoderma cornu-damae TaxID=654480 RepID=A0A9P8QGD7_9HYPO|nr:hypothetical protein Trco_004768 [Trichoderma cornu-damae]
MSLMVTMRSMSQSHRHEKQLRHGQRYGIRDVLVENAHNGNWHRSVKQVKHQDAAIRPASVHKHQALQEPELRDGVVGRHGGLPALDTGNAHADIGLLDHGDVVGAVTNGQGHDIQSVLDHGHDRGLLRRADAAAQDGPALLAEEEELLHQAIVQGPSQGETINDQSMRGSGGLVVLPGGSEILVTASQAKQPQAIVQQLLDQTDEGLVGALALGGVLVDLDMDQLHIVVEQVAGEANVDGGLDFVAGQHPELDSGLAQELDGIGHAVLETVFDGSAAEQHEVLFNELGNGLKLLLAVLEGGGGDVVLLLPLAVFLFGEILLGDAEGAETFASEHLQVLGGNLSQLLLLAPLEPRVNDGVGALAEQNDAAVGHADDGAHPLPGGVEFDGVEERVVALFAHDVDVDAVVRVAQHGEAHVASSGDQGLFVGGLSLERHGGRVAGGALSHDRVAEGQGEHEVLVGPLLLGAVVAGQISDEVGCDEGDGVVVEVGVVVDLAEALQRLDFGLGDLGQDPLGFSLDVDAGALLHAGLGFRPGFAVGLPVDGGLLELHDVLGKRSGLVREDVLDLPDVVGDVPRLRDAGLIDRLVIHFHVVEDEYGLQGAHDFEGDVEGNGDQILEDDDGRPKGDEASNAGAAADGAEVEEVLGGVRLGPGHAVDNRRKQTHDGEDDEVADDVPVHFAGDAGTLAGRDAGIHHDLGVVAGEDDDAQDPLGVSQVAASQHQVVNGDGFGHFLGLVVQVAGDLLLPPDGAIVLVEVGLGSLALDPELGALAVPSVPDAAAAAEGLSDLEVRLAVQVFGLNVAGTVGIGGGEDDDVGGELVVLVDAHKVSDHQVFPRILCEAGALDGAIIVDEIRLHGGDGIGPLHVFLVGELKVDGVGGGRGDGRHLNIVRVGDVRLAALKRRRQGITRRASRPNGLDRGARLILNNGHLPPLALGAGLGGPRALDGTPHASEKGRVGLFKPSPCRYIVLLDIYVGPVVEPMDGGVVELVVENGSSVVFNRILDGRDGNDDNEGYGVEPRVDGAEDGKELQERRFVESEGRARRFFGTNETGVYFAVRILFRG